MKKIVLLIVVITLLSTSAYCQNLIAVQNGDPPEFYTKLDSALVHAQNGDTLFISGGPHIVGNNGYITINKELHLIGVGHHPDSSYSTYFTKIYATIILVAGSNNSSFEGFSLSSFRTGTSASNEDVDNIKIARCCFNDIYLSRLSTGYKLTENIIDNLQGRFYSYIPGGNAQNNYISNNIIQGMISFFGPGNLFINNVCLYFNGTYWAAFNDIDRCVFENNIFLMGGTHSDVGISSCFFNNNLFTFNFTAPDGSMGRNNIVSQAQSSIFTNQTGNAFSYSHDYHLKTGSPGKNAGKDGTDIGLYGGTFNWKEGSIPFNPHFQTVNVAPATNQSGNLNVNIKVSAQDR